MKVRKAHSINDVSSQPSYQGQGKAMRAATRLLGMTAISGVVALSAPSAFAQQGGANAGASQKNALHLEEIIVVAQKRSENVQDVPIAISVVTASELEANAITEMSDLSTVVPGLHFSTAAAALLPRIRGVGSQISSAGNEGSVATFVDGVYFGSSAGALMPFNNLAQIAVLKGPQGTLFGRNATGGVIQVATLEPKDETEGRLSIGYGNLDALEGSLYITGGLAEGVAADLAAYYYDQGDGFGKNLLTGNDVGKRSDRSVRSKLRFDLGDTNLTFIGDYTETFGHFGGGLPVDEQGRHDPLMSPFDLAHNLDPDQRLVQWGASGTLKHDLGGVELVSITAYRRTKGRQSGDIDRIPIDLASGLISFVERQFTQEININSMGDGPLKWTLGAFYFRNLATKEDQISLGPDLTIGYGRQKTTSISAFAQGTYDLGASTNLTLGLRYTDEQKNLRVSQEIYDPFGALASFSPPAYGKLSNGKLTWRVALDHHFTPDILGYVSYSRGFKSAGFNIAKSTPPLEQFGAEVLDAYEIGMKSSFLNDRVRLNVAGFYYDYENIQINVFTDQPDPKIASGGPTEIYGLDVDMIVNPAQGLTLTGGLLLNHARFKDFPDAPLSFSPDFPFPIGQTIGSASGNRLPLTPDWTIDLGFNYETDLGSGAIRLSGNYYRNGGFFGEPDNVVRQKAYDVINASATYFFDPDRRYSLKLWGKNIGNSDYATNLASFPTTYFKVIGRGRTYGITADIQF